MNRRWLSKAASSRSSISSKVAASSYSSSAGPPAPIRARDVEDSVPRRAIRRAADVTLLSGRSTRPASQ